VSTLIVGCGYLGLRVARRMMAEGHRVFGTTRTRERADWLSEQGIEPILADVLAPETLADLPSVNRAFYCVGFDRASGVPIDAVYVDGLRRALGRLGARAKRLVYASSTGVYGDHGGDWIDCSPRRSSGNSSRRSTCPSPSSVTRASTAPGDS
jgi:nucleoside-diphosphate-sugar epimerase